MKNNLEYMRIQRYVGNRVLRYVFIVSFFLLIPFFLLARTPVIPLHIDEIAWFIDTDAFEQIFLKRDVTSSFWQTNQRYDQPPLVKYIYGGYLWMKDPKVFRNRERLEKEWGRWGIYNNPSTTETGFDIFGPYIRQMRQINSIALIGTLLAFYLLLIFVGNINIVVAMLGTALLSQNMLFLQEMTHATHDGFMLCYMVFAVLFYCLYIKNKKIFMLVLAIFCAALSVASKLTGVIVVVGILMSQMIKVLNEVKQKKQSLVHCIVITLSIFILWIFVNPTLYKEPIKNTVKYFSYRMDQTTRLQEAYPSASLIKPSDKVRASWCTLIAPACYGFYEKGTFTSLAWVNVSLVLFGLYYLIHRILNNTKQEYTYMLGIFLFLVITWNVGFLPMHYGRYYLPTQIGIFFISTCGLEWLRGRMCRRK